MLDGVTNQFTLGFANSSHEIGFVRTMVLAERFSCPSDVGNRHADDNQTEYRTPRSVSLHALQRMTPAWSQVPLLGNPELSAACGNFRSTSVPAAARLLWSGSRLHQT
jgi:hypothetical protein